MKKTKKKKKKTRMKTKRERKKKKTQEHCVIGLQVLGSSAAGPGLFPDVVAVNLSGLHRTAV